MHDSRAAMTMLLVVLGAAPAGASPTEEGVVTAGFRLCSAFWPNLHDTLYATAWAARAARTGAWPLAGVLPEAMPAGLDAEERAAWDGAVAYYDEVLATKDLLFGEGMDAIESALVDGTDEVPVSGITAAHRRALRAAAPVYRKHLWPAHDRANRAWIADAAARLHILGHDVTRRLTALYGVPWFASPHRVDIVRAANWQGAYTRAGPRAHTTLGSGNPQYSGWAAVEMLFHEAMHVLGGGVDGKIDAALEHARRRADGLWHVVLFVTVGEVVRQALAAHDTPYTPYVHANGLFRRGWERYRRPVEAHWIPYVDGTLALDDALKRLVRAL